MTPDPNYRPRPESLDPMPAPEVPARLESLPAPEPKPKTQSRTWWGIVGVVAGAVITGLGYDGSVAFLGDGIQLEDVGPAVMVLSWALARWGQRKAAGTQQPVR